MNSFAFNAGVSLVNNAIKAVDLGTAGAKATKHYATKAVATTTKATKSAAATTKETSLSFWDGMKHAREMNKALSK